MAQNVRLTYPAPLPQSPPRRGSTSFLSLSYLPRLRDVYFPEIRLVLTLAVEELIPVGGPPDLRGSSSNIGGGLPFPHFNHF